MRTRTRPRDIIHTAVDSNYSSKTACKILLLFVFFTGWWCIRRGDKNRLKLGRGFFLDGRVPSLRISRSWDPQLENLAREASDPDSSQPNSTLPVKTNHRGLTRFTGIPLNFSVIFHIENCTIRVSRTFKNSTL